MSTPVGSYQQSTALRRAAVRATFAASVRDSQPWRFVLEPSALRVFADPERQLRRFDPNRRQLIVSCGSAVFNARVSLAASGFEAEVDRSPDPARANQVTRISVQPAHGPAVDPLATLDAAIESCQPNRRAFTDGVLPAELIDLLQQAAHAEDSQLVVVRSEGERLAVGALCDRANLAQDAAVESGLSLPNQCLIVLGSAGDDRISWLRAGEALQRVLLELTRHGFVATLSIPVIEIASARKALGKELALTMFPHLVLQAGRAPSGPAVRRRRLVDVIEQVPATQVGESV